jgi:ABC-type glutathione transport system ATPase component
VARGEIVGLVGESGCGKSTLARLALRLIDPDGGRVLFDRIDITRLAAPALRGFRRRVQMVFQDPLGSLNPRATIRALLEDPLRVNRVAPRDERRRQVERIADRVRLAPALLDRYPHEISGGQRQRVGIARALALSPDLIVCDEPVSSLDVSIRAQIVNLLLELRRESGVALLFISHDLALVRRVADRVAVMQNGRIVETGPSEAVWRHPAAAYTRTLIAAQPRLTRGEP